MNKKVLIVVSILVGLSLVASFGCQTQAPAPAPKPTTAAPAASPKPTAAPAVEPIKITFAHARAANHVYNQWLQEIADMAEKDTGGKVKFAIFPGGSLYSSDKQALEAVKMGSIQGAQPSSQDFETYVPQYGIYGLPFLMPNAAAANEIIATGEVPKDLEKISASKGFKVWTLTSSDPITLYTIKTKTPRLADLKGLKIIVPPSKTFEDIMNRLGASGIGMATPERYTALAQGMADGIFTSPLSLYSFKWHELTKHGLLNPFTFSGIEIVMDLNFWNKLPPDIQAAIGKAVAQQVKKCADNLASRFDEYNKKLATEGKMTLISWPAEDMVKARELTKSVYDDSVARIGKDLLDKALAVAKKYEK